MSLKCYFQIIQNWNRDSFHSSILKVKDSIYMFNCSDGIQRRLFNIPGNQIKHVFLNSDRYETIYAYISLLYIQDKNSRTKGDFNILMKDKLFLWGPPKTRECFNSDLFPKRILSKINEFNSSSQTYISEDIKFNKKNVFHDENIRIIPISIEIDNKISINYFVEIFEERKHISYLKTILFLYFPSNLHAEKLITSQNFKDLLGKYTNIDLIVHIFEDKDLINKSFYIDFLLKYKSSKNIIDCPFFNTYPHKLLSQSFMRLFLNKTNEYLFHKDNFKEEDSKPKLILSELLNPKIKALNIRCSQSQIIEYFNNNEKQDLLKTDHFIMNNRKISEFENILHSLFPQVSEKKITENVNFHNQPKITFLGTSSARPTEYRNVSSILFNFPKKGTLLLDCGEGTFNQLFEHYGQENTDNILSDLKLIFISHQHGDHFLGILKLISEIIKIKSELINTNEDNNKVWIVGPESILKWINKLYSNNKEYNKIFQLINCEEINPNMKRVYNQSNFSEVKFKKIEEINGQLNIFRQSIESRNNIISKFYKSIQSSLGVNFYSIEVFHCEDSYGCFLEDSENKSWKVSFSGDCRPCINFINYSNYSTLTIHESTFADKDINHAKLSNHSCISEAIKVSQLNNSWRTILTHFSVKNSLSFKYSSEYEEKKILFAHDYLSFNLSDLVDAYQHSKTYDLYLEKLLKYYPNSL